MSYHDIHRFNNTCKVRRKPNANEMDNLSRKPIFGILRQDKELLQSQTQQMFSCTTILHLFMTNEVI